MVRWSKYVKPTSSNNRQTVPNGDGSFLTPNGRHLSSVTKYDPWIHKRKDGDGMYLVRRWYKTKPGEARRVATLVHKQAQAYHDADQRSEFRVSYNGYTLPGEQDVVCLEWTDKSLETPTLQGHVLPAEALERGAEVRKLIESQRIEFLELLTPEKFQDQ